MDLRVERTRKNIINAFIELRSKKPLEKITVKELAELAYINKATFYSHYKDIYDLSEQLENETIDMIIANIPHPEELISKARQTTEALAISFYSQKQLIDILFSGNRMSNLVNQFESRIRRKIYENYPEFQNDLERDVVLTYLVQGGFNAFISKSSTADLNELIRIVGDISERMLRRD